VHPVRQDATSHVLLMLGGAEAITVPGVQQSVCTGCRSGLHPHTVCESQLL